MTFSDAGPVPAQGQIAQQIFWYTAFTAPLTQPGTAAVNKDGSPKWRMAPSPHGPYWKTGMQNGYQDVGSWTFLKSTPLPRMSAAWLYAQFVTSKTVSLRKSIVGLTFIRESDIKHNYFTECSTLRRLDRVLPQPGPRGLDTHRHQCARLPPHGAPVVDQCGHRHQRQQRRPRPRWIPLAKDMDEVLADLQHTGMQHCTPRLNPMADAGRRLSHKGAPWLKLDERKTTRRNHCL
jgi:glycerol transport system substrate-binding protein